MHINHIRKQNIPKQGIRISKGHPIKIINDLLDTKYVYNFDWLGFPIIQFPSDLIVIQELIFDYKPDIIIETGIAHGGSLIFYSSILSLMKKKYIIYGVDIKIKNKNKNKILNSNFAKNIRLIEQNSSNINLLSFFKKKIKNKKILVFLDSNHSHDHVLKELELYSQLIKKNGYLVVMDTTTEFVKKKFINKGRNFGKGNSPYTATIEFLKKNKKFKIYKHYENKAFISSCYSGFLKRIE